MIKICQECGNGVSSEEIECQVCGKRDNFNEQLN